MANSRNVQEGGLTTDPHSRTPRAQQRHRPWRGCTHPGLHPVQASWGHALVLTAEGDLHGLNLDTGEAHGLMRVCLPADVPKPWGAGGFSGWRLHASADGKHAALVQDAGRHGVLLAVDRKLEVAALYGGDYYPSTVPFSACFARHAGRDVLICRSDWNRLDVQAIC